MSSKKKSPKKDKTSQKSESDSSFSAASVFSLPSNETIKKPKSPKKCKTIKTDKDKKIDLISKKKQGVPSKLSRTTSKSPDYVRKVNVKRRAKQTLKLISKLDQTLTKLKLNKNFVKEQTDFEAAISYRIKSKTNLDSASDLVKKESIEIIKKKILNQGKLNVDCKAKKDDYEIALKQTLDTDDNVFAVIDSKEVLKKKEPKIKTSPVQNLKASFKLARHAFKKKAKKYKHKESKLIKLLTKRKNVQKVLEENLIKRIKKNSSFRSDHIKTDIRLACKNNNILIEPVVNSDLLYSKDVKTELEKLIETFNAQKSGKLIRTSSLNETSKMIKAIVNDSRVLKDLNKEIETELNRLNALKLQKKVKVIKKQEMTLKLNKKGIDLNVKELKKDDLVLKPKDIIQKDNVDFKPLITVKTISKKIPQIILKDFVRAKSKDKIGKIPKHIADVKIKDKIGTIQKGTVAVKSKDKIDTIQKGTVAVKSKDKIETIPKDTVAVKSKDKIDTIPKDIIEVLPKEITDAMLNETNDKTDYKEMKEEIDTKEIIESAEKKPDLIVQPRKVDSKPDELFKSESTEIKESISTHMSEPRKGDSYESRLRKKMDEFKNEVDEIKISDELEKNYRMNMKENDNVCPKLKQDLNESKPKYEIKIFETDDKKWKKIQINREEVIQREENEEDKPEIKDEKLEIKPDRFEPATEVDKTEQELESDKTSPEIELDKSEQNNEIKNDKINYKELNMNDGEEFGPKETEEDKTKENFTNENKKQTKFDKPEIKADQNNVDIEKNLNNELVKNKRSSDNINEQKDDKNKDKFKNELQTDEVEKNLNETESPNRPKLDEINENKEQSD